MSEWWQALTSLNRWFYGVAVVLSIPFLWQLVAAFMGLDADTDTDTELDSEAVTGQTDVSDADATVLAFKLLSVRALLAFFVLFSWSGALYLDRGVPLVRTLGISMLWGLAGLVCVGLLLYLLPRLAHSGNRDLDHAIGSEATVYLDIPAQGIGEVRAVVDGTLSHIKARALHGAAIKAGASVRIVRRIGQTLVEVEPQTFV
ncbi:MAG: hypothetical protein PHR35_10680 [Kiritimatiellae bacterium]|nr:hypothetical protein [Kiritimatiellia bacterium]